MGWMLQGATLSPFALCNNGCEINKTIQHILDIITWGFRGRAWFSCAKLRYLGEEPLLMLKWISVLLSQMISLCSEMLHWLKFPLRPQTMLCLLNAAWWYALGTGWVSRLRGFFNYSERTVFPLGYIRRWCLTFPVSGGNCRRAELWLMDPKICQQRESVTAGSVFVKMCANANCIFDFPV